MRLTAQKVRGFTLIELLVVIAIIGILAALIVLAINPAEIQRKSRDATRISDVVSLRKALDLAIVDGAILQGDTTTPYASDSNGTRTASDPTNYVGVDVSVYVSILPQDPSNDGTTDAITVTDGTATGRLATTKADMVYEFASDGANYEAAARLESSENASKITGDGGSDNGTTDPWYEIGTDPALDLYNPT